MRRVNELVIRGPAAQLASWLEYLEESFTDGWQRDRATEERLRRVLHGQAVCIDCPPGPGWPAAGLWINWSGRDERRISQIVPLQRQDLSDEDYNRLLAEFESRFARPAAQRANVQTAIVPPCIRIKDYLSWDAWDRLKAFMAVADPTTPRPGDQEPWRAFVFQVQLDDRYCDPEILGEWLAEQGWPEERRRELLQDYEASRCLLVAYDEYRRQAYKEGWRR